MTYIEELDMLMQEGKGLLSPHRVVEYARDPETALHSRFEWDDAKAAYAHRLQQARIMISVLVTQREDIRVKKFVSVSVDRKRDDSGGYRAVESVLSNDDLRNMFLDQCIRAIEALLTRFGQFKDLATILADAKTRLEGLQEYPDMMAPTYVGPKSSESPSLNV